jgi:hypothetical protein
VDPSGLEPDDDLVHEQGELLRPARRGDVHRQFAPALGPGLGARSNPLTDDLPPLLAVDGGPSVASRCLA